MKPNARVFIPQHPMRFDVETKTFVREQDLSDVMRFGHPIFMLPPGRAHSSYIGRMITTLEQAMFDFDAKTDYILPVGEPVAVAATMIVAARTTDAPLRVLRWGGPWREDLSRGIGRGRYRVFCLHTKGANREKVAD